MKLRRRDAAAEAATLRSLFDAPIRRVVRVRSLEWDEPVSARRLSELGLTPGTTLLVLNRTPTAVVVAARGSRVAVGLDLAGRVLVDATTELGA